MSFCQQSVQSSTRTLTTITYLEIGIEFGLLVESVQQLLLSAREVSAGHVAQLDGLAQLCHVTQQTRSVRALLLQFHFVLGAGTLQSLLRALFVVLSCRALIGQLLSESVRNLSVTRDITKYGQ